MATLPESDYALVRLSNADFRTFTKYGKKVKEVIKETMPMFIEARTLRAFNRTTNQKNAEKARGKRNLIRQRKEARLTDFFENTHVGINSLPPDPNPFNTGYSDPIARQKAIKNNKADPGTWMKDK